MFRLASMPTLSNPFDRLTPEERAARDAEARAWREEQERAGWMRRVEASGVPPRYRAATLADCCEEVRAYAAGLASGNTGWLYLRGENGRGKTHQATAVLNEQLRRGRGRFATMQAILDECRDTFGRPESAAAVQAKYMGTPLLVLDDLGKEQATDWSLPVIFAVIDGRYNRMLPTVMTSNMGATELLVHLTRGGDRTLAESVVSRLRDARHVIIKGRDWRQRDVRI